MASENSMKDKVTQTSSRQKVIIVVMIIVVLIIGWQIMGLMGGDSTPPPTIQPIAKVDASSPADPNAPAKPLATQNNLPAASSPDLDESLKQSSIVNDPQFNRLQRITEEKYVGKLNELEELRIQRQIAETNQAIAAAKLATVTAEKDIGDLLTQPSPSAMAYAEAGVKTSVDLAPASSSDNPDAQSPVPIPVIEVAPYKLISVSMLFNKWTAVVTLQDTMFSVGVGDTLPPDGSLVTNISKSSVILKKEGQSRKVSITASL